MAKLAIIYMYIVYLGRLQSKAKAHDHLILLCSEWLHALMKDYKNARKGKLLGEQSELNLY